MGKDLARTINRAKTIVNAASAVSSHKKHSYRRGTARRAMSVEILSVAHNCTKSHLKRLAVATDLEVLRTGAQACTDRQLAVQTDGYVAAESVIRVINCCFVVMARRKVVFRVSSATSAACLTQLSVQHAIVAPIVSVPL